MRKTVVAAAALIVAMYLAAPTPSQAITIGTCGPTHSLDAVNEGGVQIGFCEKEVTLLDDVLTITLTNTSPVDNLGFIVADAFSLPAGTADLVSSTDADFAVSLNGAVVVAPFVNRTVFVALGGTLENAFETFGGTAGENADLGIGVGDSVTFVFNLVGATGATEQGIFASQLIRFSGFVTHAPGDRTSVTIISSTTPTPVPEASTFWLLGIALMSAGLWSRRRLAS